MKGSLLLLLALLHGGCLQGGAANSVCTSQTGCQCVTPKVTIDLNNYFTYPIKDLKDPRTGNEKFTYSFSPCQPMSCYQGQNITAAACQHNSKDPEQSVSLGVDSQIQWTSVTNDRNFEILITGGHPTNEYQGHPSVPRHTVVIFSSNTSDSENTLKFIDDVYSTTVDIYYFEASVITIGSGVPDGTVGIVLIVIFIVVVATYFIVGGLIMYFMRGARGVEVIPNYTFWKDLPFLIKDGFLFTISPCRNKFSEKGYQAL